MMLIDELFMTFWLDRDPDVFSRRVSKDRLSLTAQRFMGDQIYTQNLSSLVTNSQLYSNYESHTTFKALLNVYQICIIVTYSDEIKKLSSFTFVSFHILNQNILFP